MNGVAAEHLREAIPVISSYGDALGIRAFAEGRDLADDLADKEFMRHGEALRKPLDEHGIGDPASLPGLADWKTMDELGVPKRAASSCCPG